MKFSYSLIKKLAPGTYTKEALIEKLNLHSFETIDLGGDILEIAITPNRFSDAASHIGIAREAAAIMKVPAPKEIGEKDIRPDVKKPGVFTVHIKDKDLCSRYLATYVSNVKVGSSPAWMKDALESCGLRSINNVVDTMNYVMLELGQPLHAFDADAISGGVVARRAHKNEQLETIDEKQLMLSSEQLVIADADKPLAVAGIKGGKQSEVTGKTKHILVESANFDGAHVYRASRALGLVTDASVRFSHNLSPELARVAMNRALEILQEVAGGTVYQTVDVYPKKASRRLIKFDLKKVNALIGYEFSAKEAWWTLQALGFRKKGSFVEVPWYRADVEMWEDLAEEIVRIHGYNALAAKAPTVALAPAVQQDQLILKDQIRNILIGAGFSEVYNYSFLSQKEAGERAPELANPISSQSAFLRDSLLPHVAHNLENNSKFFDEVRIFEIGTVFLRNADQVEERTHLCMGMRGKESALELKGLADMLLARLGITEYEAVEADDGKLKFIVDGKEVGFLLMHPDLRNAALAEFDLLPLLALVSEEREFVPLPKFPSIVRDFSIFVPADVRVGEILALIQRVSSKLVQDVDLIDFYEPPFESRDRSKEEQRRRKSLTFRIVFQAEDRTLTDAEADREMAAINQVVIDTFDAELR